MESYWIRLVSTVHGTVKRYHFFGGLTLLRILEAHVHLLQPLGSKLRRVFSSVLAVRSGPPKLRWEGPLGVAIAR